MLRQSHGDLARSQGRPTQQLLVQTNAGVCSEENQASAGQKALHSGTSRWQIPRSDVPRAALALALQVRQFRCYATTLAAKNRQCRPLQAAPTSRLPHASAACCTGGPLPIGDNPHVKQNTAETQNLC